MSSRSRRAALACACLVAVAAPARGASKAPSDDEEPVDLRDRTEYAGFPVIGGSTDIGFQFGVAGTISHVGDGFKPYWWNVDGILSASVKDGPRGVEIVQQSQAMRWDIPGGGGGKVRLMPGLFYDKTINSGYFGLGNAAPVVTLPDGTVGDRYQFRHEEAAVRLAARTPLTQKWSTMYGWQLRYVHPKAYPNSRLAIDAATRLSDGRPLLYGLGPLGIVTLNAALLYDTRDDEIQPKRGAYYSFSLRVSDGRPEESGVRWVGANATLRWYAKLGGPFVFANRIIVDLMAGHVPFYDLSQGAAFDPDDMPGGAEGVRGIPNGRYSGLVKLVVNTEIRSVFFGFEFLGGKFKVGNSVFFDMGRVWNDYTFSDPRDGTGLGMRYGVGTGPFLVWGSAALFRVDVAYSPDATAANPGFPVGIYVQQGFIF
ncbi:MAG: BamA/TamA family outer membrane protein [Labilithrix sp.]|nr:BamA/TamA family outer membrane protein [Labilithrix sp.]